MTEIKTGTWLRTVALVIALVNQMLAIFGKEALPFGEEEIYQAVSLVMTLIASLVAWWKNNSFTKAALAADAVLKEKREGVSCE